MGYITRRKFLKYSLGAGGTALASQFTNAKNLFGQSREKLKLNIGYLPIADHLILPVSKGLDNGLYNYINVNPCLCQSWDEISGKMDMGILNAAFMLAPLAMHKVINGASMRCLLLGHTNGSVIAVNKTITNGKDLNGKTIGIPHSKSTHRVLLYKYFKDRGMEKNINIKLVKIPPPLTIASLKSGKIDGYCVAEPWGSQGLKAGVADILESSHNIIPNHACCIVMVKNRIIDKHMDGISEWVKSLINAGKFIHTNPKQAGLMQKPFMNQVPEDIAQAIKKEFISYVNIKPDKAKLDIIGKLSLECGLLHEKYNFSHFVDNRFA